MVTSGFEVHVFCVPLLSPRKIVWEINKFELDGCNTNLYSVCGCLYFGYCISNILQVPCHVNNGALKFRHIPLYSLGIQMLLTYVVHFEYTYTSQGAHIK